MAVMISERETSFRGIKSNRPHRYPSRIQVVVVVDLPLLRVAVEGSDNPVSLEKPCQASLPPDQQGRHSLGRQPEVQYIA